MKQWIEILHTQKGTRRILYENGKGKNIDCHSKLEVNVNGLYHQLFSF